MKWLLLLTLLALPLQAAVIRIAESPPPFATVDAWFESPQDLIGVTAENVLPAPAEDIAYTFVCSAVDYTNGYVLQPSPAIKEWVPWEFYAADYRPIISLSHRIDHPFYSVYRRARDAL